MALSDDALPVAAMSTERSYSWISQYLPRVEGLSLVRPRYLAYAFLVYFGGVGYLAWSFARRWGPGSYSPDISRAVYQTTMVGGVLVLIGLFLTSSILPHLSRTFRPKGTNPSSAGLPSTDRSSIAFPSISRRASQSADPEWAVDGILEDSGVDPSRYMDARQERDSAAISAALSRLLPASNATNPGNLMERLAGIRARKSGLLVPEDREMTQVLLRLVGEIKPLLVAAKKAGLNVPEIRRVVSEATAGREGDLPYRVRVVEQLKDTLESALVERIAENLQSVLVDIGRTKSASQQADAAELTASEGVALLDAGNYSAAIDRAMKARETIAHQTSSADRSPPTGEWVAAEPISLVPLIGPSIVASLYVAIGAMLLPAVDGFLVSNYIVNTTAILFLSYGWFGLILYALASVYLLARSPGQPPTSNGLP